MTSLSVLADIVIRPPTPVPTPAPLAHPGTLWGALPYAALAIVALGVLWFLRKARATEPNTPPRTDRR